MSRFLLICVLTSFSWLSANAQLSLNCASPTAGITTNATGTLGASGHYLTFSCTTFSGGCYGYGFNYKATNGTAGQYINGFNAAVAPASIKAPTTCGGATQDYFTAAQTWGSPTLSSDGKTLTFTMANQAPSLSSCLSTITWSSIQLQLTLSAVSGSLTNQQVWNVNTTTGDVWVPLGQTPAVIANLKIRVAQTATVGGVNGPTQSNVEFEVGTCTAGAYQNSSHLTWGYMTVTPTAASTITPTTNPICSGSSLSLTATTAPSDPNTVGSSVTGQTTYAWSGTGTSSPTTSNTQTVASPATGTYGITMTDYTGCSTTSNGSTAVTVTAASSNVTLPTSNNNTHTLTSTCTEGTSPNAWTYYIDPAYPTQYLLGINYGSNTSFTPFVTVTTPTSPGTADNSATNITTKKEGVWAMGRYWNVVFNSTAGGSAYIYNNTATVQMRFFYDAAALTQAYNDALAFATTYYGSGAAASHVHAVEWFTTTHNIPYNPATELHPGDVVTTGFATPPTHYDPTLGTAGTTNGVTYVQMSWAATKFTGFGGTAAYRVDGNTTNNALPITLLSFSASPVNKSYIILNWSTASETNSSGFQLQKSSDGVSFEDIAWIPGAGNSISTLNYDYIDRNCDLNTVYYYRLNSVDNDGIIEPSDIVSAVLLTAGDFIFEGIWPNPAANKITVDVSSNSLVTAKLTMIDMIGRTVVDQPWSVTPGTNTTELDLSGMSDGTYTVIVDNGRIKYSKKLVVIH